MPKQKSVQQPHVAASHLHTPPRPGQMCSMRRGKRCRDTRAMGEISIPVYSGERPRQEEPCWVYFSVRSVGLLLQRSCKGFVDMFAGLSLFFFVSNRKFHHPNIGLRNGLLLFVNHTLLIFKHYQFSSSCLCCYCTQYLFYALLDKTTTTSQSTPLCVPLSQLHKSNNHFLHPTTVQTTINTLQ